MDENMIIGKKIDLKKFFKRAGLIVLIFFVVVSIFTFPGYLKYRKAQDILIETSTLIPSYKDFSHKEKVEYLYGQYTYYSPAIPGYTTITVSGYAMNKAAAELLNEMGYECELASEYLEHAGILSYMIHKALIPYTISLILMLFLLCIKIWSIKDLKKNIVVEENKIICQNGNKVVKEFLIKDISSVESSRLNGVILRGNNIKYKVNLLTNTEEIKSKIIELLEKTKAILISEDGSRISNSIANEIKEYKELLDNGVISQEEFDTKKKQLLGL